jgi:hypothetical protein
MVRFFFETSFEIYSGLAFLFIFSYRARRNTEYQHSRKPWHVSRMLQRHQPMQVLQSALYISSSTGCQSKFLLASHVCILKMGQVPRKKLFSSYVIIVRDELKWVLPIPSPARSKSFELLTVIYKFPLSYFKFDKLYNILPWYMFKLPVIQFFFTKKLM